MKSCLHSYLLDAASESVSKIALAYPGREHVTYGELHESSEKFKDYLVSLGVKPGDRVGLCLPKTIDTVICIYGVLKSGAAYVPVDSSGPLDRAAFIFSDCSVRVVVVEQKISEMLADILNESIETNVVPLDTSDGNALKQLMINGKSECSESPRVSGDDLAYILYTSGSTGTPKGVQVSHRASMAFVDWSYSLLTPLDSDVFSSHAPFHFDLSIFDLYVSAKSCASVVLIPEETGKDPMLLSELIERCQISVWYSAPSILNMLLEYGNLADRTLPQLRYVIFAGEVFPINQLKKLTSKLRKQTYYNFYGPTETNVCTYARVPEKFYESDCEALPIGHVCEHLSAIVVGSDRKELGMGETGELLISGDNVMRGYWNLPDRTDAAFLNTEKGNYYHTGDLVYQKSDGQFVYVGRNDRMVKKRGYRIELGEIESIILKHDSIIEACAIAKDGKFGIYIYLHYSGRSGQKISGIALKKYCSENLPKYMVPDGFLHHSVLPKTSTDKIDMQALKAATPDKD